MAEPTIPVWDSNGTNITTITSGHASDGYAVNEIPVSGEFNDLFKKLTAWIAWASARLNGLKRWEWTGISGGTLTGATLVSPNGYLEFDAAGEKAEWIKFNVPVGATITKVGVVYTMNESIGAVADMTVELIKTNGGTTPTVIGTITNLDSIAPLDKKTTTLGSPYTVADGDVFYFRATNGALGHNYFINAFGCEINTVGI